MKKSQAMKKVRLSLTAVSVAALFALSGCTEEGGTLGDYVSVAQDYVSVAQSMEQEGTLITVGTLLPYLYFDNTVYVLSGTGSPDLINGIWMDRNVVKGVTVDDSAVSYDIPGIYTATISAEVDTEAFRRASISAGYLADFVQASSLLSMKGTDPYRTVTYSVRIRIVTQEDAVVLEGKGTPVYGEGFQIVNEAGTPIITAETLNQTAAEEKKKESEGTHTVDMLTKNEAEKATSSTKAAEETSPQPTEPESTTIASTAKPTSPATTAASTKPTKSESTTAATTQATKPESTTAATKPTIKPEPTTAAPTQATKPESTTAAAKPTIKPEPTTAAPTQPTSKPEPTTQAHIHSWVAIEETVHHPAETHVVHHDAETHVVHHEAETHVVHHDAVGHEEPIMEEHTICNGCGQIVYGDYGLHILECENWGSYHSEWIQVGTNWVIDQAAWDETVVDKAAWDEIVVDKEAWDEIVVDKEAWDEIVITGYRCSECGATK